MAGGQLSSHFTLDDAKGTAAPIWVQTALAMTCKLLAEPIYTIVGGVRITSGYRTEAQNRAAGGASDSQHMDGTAVDLAPLRVSLFDAYLKLSAATKRGELAFGQLIYYPLDGHIHAARSTRGKVSQVLLNFGGDDYPAPTPDLLAKFPGAPSAGSAAVVAALAGLGLLAWKG